MESIDIDVRLYYFKLDIDTIKYNLRRGMQMSTKKSDPKVSTAETKVVAEKREFMKKFGKYAIAGAGMAVLMTPTKSKAVMSYIDGTN